VVFDALGRCHEEVLTTNYFGKQLKTASRGNGREHAETTAWNPPFKRLPTLKEASTALVLEAVKRSDNNLTKAAALLGISRQAISKRLKNIYFY